MKFGVYIAEISSLSFSFCYYLWRVTEDYTTGRGNLSPYKTQKVQDSGVSRHLARTISSKSTAIFNVTMNSDISLLLNHSKAIRRTGNRNTNSFINET